MAKILVSRENFSDRSNNKNKKRKEGEGGGSLFLDLSWHLFPFSCSVFNFSPP